MNIYSKAKISPSGKVNEKDLKKIARDTAIFFAAPSLMYLAQLTGSLNANHILYFHDFIPNSMTIGTIEGWAIGILINFFLRLNNSKE